MLIATGGCGRPISTVTKLTETGNGAAIDGLTGQSISDPAKGARNLTWSYDLVGNRVASTDSGAATNQKSITYVDNNTAGSGIVPRPTDSAN